MNQKTKKIDIKVIVIVAITIIAVIEGIFLFTSNKGNSKEDNTETLTTEQCIGTWKLKESNSAYLPTLTLYKGGTGEAQKSDGKTTILIQWKIEDNVLKLDTSFDGHYTSAYIIENNTMTNVNGENTYNKVK